MKFHMQWVSNRLLMLKPEFARVLSNHLKRRWERKKANYMEKVLAGNNALHCIRKNNWIFNFLRL